MLLMLKNDEFERRLDVKVNYEIQSHDQSPF